MPNKGVERAKQLIQSQTPDATSLLRYELHSSRKTAELYMAEAAAILASEAAPRGAARAVGLSRAAAAHEQEAGLLADRKASSLDRALAQERARESSFLGELERLAKAVFRDKIVVRTTPSARKKSPHKRAVNLMLSDLHFGADLDGQELPVQYGPEEEARRFGHVMVQTADYKPQYRDDSVLNVHLLGDIVQNQLHDCRDGVELARQAMAAISYLTQGIAYQAARWREVNVFCATGNHGRFTSRHPGRATNQKWDSLETVVYFSVKQALGHLQNVKFHLHKQPYYTWHSFGEWGFGTHGDTVLNPGQPSKSIDISRLEAQIHELNDGFRANRKPPCKLFIHGHTHRAYVSELGTGETLIGNGMLVPPDGYAVSLGKLSGQCAMVLWESVEGFMAGDFRMIKVGQAQDKDRTLDAVVRRFEGI